MVVIVAVVIGQVCVTVNRLENSGWGGEEVAGFMCGYVCLVSV